MALDALPFFTGFDHLSSLTQLLNTDSGFDGYEQASLLTLTSDGRGAIGTTNSSLEPKVQVSFPASLLLTAGYRLQSNGGAFGEATLIAFYGSNGDRKAGLLYDYSSQSLIVRNDAGSSIDSLSVDLETTDTETYVEFAVSIDDSAGAYEVRLDGQIVMSGTGENFGTVAPNSVTFSGKHASFTDIYIKEWDSPSNPGCYNTLKCTLAVPDSDVSVAWTPDSGGTNYSQVDEAPADGDSTYIETTTDAAVDQYGTTSAVAGDRQVVAVQPFAVVGAPNEGAPSLELGVSDGADEYGSPRVVGGARYRTVYGKAHLTAPSGGSWTNSAANSLDLLVRAQT